MRSPQLAWCAAILNLVSWHDLMFRVGLFSLVEVFSFNKVPSKFMTKNITSNQAKTNKNFHIAMTQICLTNHRIVLKLGQITTATISQSHALFRARSLNSSFFFTQIKENLKETHTRWRTTPTASEKMVDISKDYKLDNICHENSIVPIDELWPTELGMTKIVQC